jgi:hypothetical protein
MKITKLIPAVVASATLLTSIDAQADSFGFSQLSNNAGVDISNQLSVDVKDVGGEVCFTFSNIGTISSVISEIYFDDAPAGPGNNTGYLGWMTEVGSGWSSYSGSPSDLPGGNTAIPAFTTDGTPIQYATANNPSPKNGIDLGESLALCFSYKNGGTIDDVIADLVSGALRIGLHIQAIGTSGRSDAYITGGGTTSVPDGGATMLLLGMGIVALGIGSLKGIRRTQS